MSEQNNTKQKLTLFGLTWPIFIETLLHMLMGNADTLMLSQYSDNAVAAVGVANQIIAVIIVMFGFVAAGAAILVAQNLGASNRFEAVEISVTSISLNLWFSLILSIGVYLLSKPILQLMNIPNELFGDATVYLNLVGGFIFVQALIMTVSAILRSYGFTKDTMYVTIGMNVLNVIGNYLFIFGSFGFPVLGVKGVAISTIISRGLGFIVLLFLLLKRTEYTLPGRAFFTYQKHHAKDLLHIGIPSAGEQLSYNMSQMVITYFIAQLGTVALTTKVYTQNLMMFIFLFAIAIGQGAQILIGHMIGANKLKDAYDCCIKSLKVAIVVSIVGAVIIYFSSGYLMRIFTDNLSIIEQGSMLLLLTIVLEPGRAFNIVVISSLRAAGDVKFPVYIGIMSMWGISVTFAWFFGMYLGLGLIGIWIAFIADEWLRGMLMLRRWTNRSWMDKHFVQKASSN
ncbi:MATE family efflux transporter [Radiobacillus sp. PE A8.2]|uniref:MATE family efflux transporter n=1 Tax=Radiobacillus sp. PE A8.2 TaxID=3380349 RepID=UPI003891101D